jgi:glucose-6-phosphate 1-epimerase
VVSITGETDRVYTPSMGTDQPIIVSEGGKQVFEIARDNLDNVVIWNPWAEKAKSMGDFEPKDGYKQMICVEAGQVDGWQKLEAGETFEGGQIIKANL